MTGHIRPFSELICQPLPGRPGIGHGLLGSKGLGGDDEQGCFRIQRLEALVKMSGIDIGNKVTGKAGMAVSSQGFGRHSRPEIRTADADIDHISDLFACAPCPLSLPDPGGEIPHLVQDRVHLRHDVPSVDCNRPIGSIAQGDVQNTAVFGPVDTFSGKHGLDPGRKIHLPGQGK